MDKVGTWMGFFFFLLSFSNQFVMGLIMDFLGLYSSGCDII